jgi:hypothetical protein
LGCSRSLRVEKPPTLWRHRDFRVWWLGQSVSLNSSFLLGGALGQTAGLVATLIVGVALNVLSVVPTVASPLHSLREVPQSGET